MQSLFTAGVGRLEPSTSILGGEGATAVLQPRGPVCHIFIQLDRKVPVLFVSLVEKLVLDRKVPVLGIKWGEGNPLCSGHLC